MVHGMNCLKIPRSPFSSSSSSKRKTRNTVHDAHEPAYFMDGKATTLSTFELGEDNDSWQDENISPDETFGDESILASSHFNSTMNLPLSAPTSIARNKIQACSTPKDESESQEESVQRILSPRNRFNGGQVYAPVWNTQCKERRDLYRCSRMRNMAASPPKPTNENVKNSYFTKENRPIIERMRRESLEKHEREKEESRREKFKLLRQNAAEYIISFIVTFWQLFYIINVIPNNNTLCYLANIAICIGYTVVFMAPHKILWAIVSCSFIVYMAFVWMFGANCAFGTFAFAAIFAKAGVTMLQACLILGSH